MPKDPRLIERWLTLTSVALAILMSSPSGVAAAPAQFPINPIFPARHIRPAPIATHRYVTSGFFRSEALKQLYLLRTTSRGSAWPQPIAYSGIAFVSERSTPLRLPDGALVPAVQVRYAGVTRFAEDDVFRTRIFDLFFDPRSDLLLSMDVQPATRAQALQFHVPYVPGARG